MAKSVIETKWSVRDIQRAIVAYTRNYNSIPNVAWGFFGRMECDLVQVSDSGRIREFEIKRSWSDFMADFKKARFHDDIRICRLTFVLPWSFAGDRLKKFCADHYTEFKREFDFLFYTEGDRCKIMEGQWSMMELRFLPEEQYRTETYITPEMLAVIRKNDVAAPYRRKLFTEELAKLYRLGVIRLWHWPQEKTPIQTNSNEEGRDMTFDTNTNKAYECPVCHGHNCEFDDAENLPNEGYFDGAHLPASFFCNDCNKEYRVYFTLRAEKSTENAKEDT